MASSTSSIPSCCRTDSRPPVARRHRFARPPVGGAEREAPGAPGTRSRRPAASAAATAGIAAALSALACGGSPPETLGARDGALAPCPATPNCVHTADPEEERRATRFRLRSEPDAVWDRVVEIVRAMPRTRVVSRTETYLHAEARSRVFRFVDDLELLLKPEEAEIVVRSASRMGRSDLGVNRRRVERLRGDLRDAGIIH